MRNTTAGMMFPSLKYSIRDAMHIGVFHCTAGTNCLGLSNRRAFGSAVGPK